MKLFLWAAVTAILLTGCHGVSDGKLSDARVIPPSPQQEVVQFPSPRIPDFIIGADERMNYMLEHYWEAYDFCDTTDHNRTVGEQGFANFLNLLQYADSAVAARSVMRYLEKGFALRPLRPLYGALIRHYLDNPDSPLRNDVLYAHFLCQQIPFYEEDEMAERERCTFLLRMVSRNQPGRVAVDFCFVDRKGHRQNLHSLDSPLTLLVFSDPDCETCQKEMPRLISDPLLQRPGLSVVVVYPDADTDRWKSFDSRMPANWIDACSPGGEVMRRALYYLPAMPSLYLLDARKRVILKDAPYEQVRKYIADTLKQHPLAGQ